MQPRFSGVSAWLGSLAKLDAVSDIQAVCCGARGIFQLSIDLAELSANHGLAERFHAFTMVERFHDAKLRVEFADETQIDPSDVAQERAYITDPANVAECDRLRDKFFLDKKGKRSWPKSWAPSSDNWQRCQSLGPEYRKLYRFLYKRLSWFVHPGNVGTGGIPEDGLKAFYGWAHIYVQDCTRLALDIVAREFHLFDGYARGLAKR